MSHADDEAAVRAELSEIARQLAEAEDRVADGQPVALHGLEARVDKACDGLLALPAERAKRYTQALEDMIAALDKLEAALADQATPADTDAESRSTPAQARRAQAAYQRRKPG